MDFENSIRENMKEKSSEELIEIWKNNDREAWSNSAFEIIKDVLMERHIALPPQQPPALPTPDKPGKNYFPIVGLLVGIIGFYLLGYEPPKYSLADLQDFLQSLWAFSESLNPKSPQRKRYGNHGNHCWYSCCQYRFFHAHA